VIRHIEGFEDTSNIVHAPWYRHEEPVTAMVVDRPERLDRFLAAVTPWVLHGTIIRSKARVRRVQRQT